MPTTSDTTVRWYDTEPEYVAAASAPVAGCAVPVLAPTRPDLARRWADVLTHRYGAPHQQRLGLRVVVAWGAEAEPAARVFAACSGSRLALAMSVDDAVTTVRDAPESAAVVVGYAARFTVSALARLTSGAGRPVGVLCGRDSAALSFAVAKALLRPAVAVADLRLFDAPSHRAEDNPRLPVTELLAGLRTPSRVAVLRSHGEGGHAKYGGVVVCGLLDQAEFPRGAHAGCVREPRSCKRATATGAEVVFGDEIAATTVCFLCCNGFNVAQELYPSPVSMALSLSEGVAAAVIAPTRPLVAPDTLLESVRAGLTGGTALGELVVRLNQFGARLGQRDAFVLLGDPCQAAIEGDAETGAGPSAQPTELADLRVWLASVLRHTERGRRLVRALRSWLAERADDLLADPVRRLDDVERLALYALKWAEVEPAGEALRRLLRSATVIRLRIARWDETMAGILLDVRDTADVFDLGHYDQLLLRIDDGPPCARCGTPTEHHRFGAGEPAGLQRVAVLCRVCGPIRESGMTGPSLVVQQSPAYVRGGENIRIVVELDFPGDRSRVTDVARLRLRLFDKAGDRCVHDETRVVPTERALLEFDFAVPPELGVDLHSARLVAVSGFDVAYARVRVAGLPRTPDVMA
ncbi:hypothetical protein [Amycolatopsis sp. GM8]|uniref:hypothetical protein n=1 Tax=Amycolatopsis sp. GM8 TaxID=2896530 RepID=UPI001F24C9ED|nr:hypothetical protein [Amycolatopsis sp. GM8]